MLICNQNWIYYFHIYTKVDLTLLYSANKTINSDCKSNRNEEGIERGTDSKNKYPKAVW